MNRSHFENASLVAAKVLSCEFLTGSKVRLYSMDSGRALVAGAAAGLAVDISLFPMDTLKTRLQAPEGFRAAGGFKHVYRGLGPVALGSAPGSALFFVTYSSLHAVYPQECTFTFLFRLRA